VNARYGEVVQFGVSASGPVVSFAAADLPAGAAFDTTSGLFQWVPAVAQTGTHKIVFSATNTEGDSITASSVLEADSGSPSVTEVVNAAGLSTGAACSAGAVGKLKGRWLTTGPTASDPTGNSMELAGSSVRINGAAVPILGASPSQIDFLCPAAAPGSNLQIIVETPDGATSPVQTVSQQSAPGIFSVDGSGKGQGTISHSGTAELAMIPNYRYASRAALAGESLTIYTTGIDPSSQVSAVIGGTEVSAQSIAAVPGHAGVFAVSVTVPNVETNENTSVSLKAHMLDGSVIQSNEVSVSIQE
jgi:uncharacterized protein (TIGR03437 family)